MEFRRIGPLTVSVVGLGCNNFGRRLDESDSAAVVHAALDAGINFFDTADVYGRGEHPYSGRGRSETFLGRALGSRRDQAVVASKFGMAMSEADPTKGGGGRAWVRRALEDSLRRLGTDYLDLYQFHRPDPDTPIAETLGILGELVEEGKVRAVGCSNFSAAQLGEAESAARDQDTPRFESVQNEYSLLVRGAEGDVLPLCAELGIAFVPYFPLASGLLTGKYRRGEAAPPDTRLAWWDARPHLTLNERALDTVDRLTAVAEASGRSLLDLAFSWLLMQPTIPSVIAGATRPEQVASNVTAAAWKLDPDELAAVDAIGGIDVGV
jgi:aryl-alcohol dehydrogenase-like predicted oxidoreductase